MDTSKKNSLLACIGAGLEYYDFIVYGLMAEVLSFLFFASDSSYVAQLKTFAVFSVGYIARPLGGIIFGILSDSIGRKKSFLIVMYAMAFSTLFIGLLPTYNQVGILAPIGLVILRIIQGISFGAELPGAVTIVYESSGKQKISSYMGFVISSVGIGSILASLILYMLNISYTKEEILQGFWRFPFLFGGTLAIINAFIRKHLKETNDNISKSFTLSPLTSLLRNRFSELILGIGLTWSLSSLIIFYLYLPTFLKTHYSFSSETIYSSITVGLIWSAITLPICGKLADKINKNIFFCLSCFISVFIIYNLFFLLDYANNISLFIFAACYQTLISFLSVSYFPIIASLFLSSSRNTGIALIYNCTYSIMGFLPLFITWILDKIAPNSLAILFSLNCLISGISCLVLTLKNKYKDKLFETVNEPAN